LRTIGRITRLLAANMCSVRPRPKITLAGQQHVEQPPVAPPPAQPPPSGTKGIAKAGETVAPPADVLSDDFTPSQIAFVLEGLICRPLAAVQIDDGVRRYFLGLLQRRSH
jgi:hypothetical protein